MGRSVTRVDAQPRNHFLGSGRHASVAPPNTAAWHAEKREKAHIEDNLPLANFRRVFEKAYLKKEAEGLAPPADFDRSFLKQTTLKT